MILTTKTFVEELYGNNKEINEIERRDPTYIEKTEFLDGIRFFDMSLIIYDNKTYKGPKENYSNWIYFGNKYSLETLKKTYDNKPSNELLLLINDMKSHNCNKVCFTQGGHLILMGEEDLTWDEFMTKTDEGKEYNLMQVDNKLRQHFGEIIEVNISTEDGLLRKRVRLIETYGLAGIVVCDPNLSINECTYKDSIEIRYIGKTMAISSIVSSDGEELYSNPYIDDVYICNTNEEALNQQIQMFGNNYVCEDDDYWCYVEYVENKFNKKGKKHKL